MSSYTSKKHTKKWSNLSLKLSKNAKMLQYAVTTVSGRSADNLTSARKKTNAHTLLKLYLDHLKDSHLRVF